jgi:hypothetical protein
MMTAMDLSTILENVGRMSGLIALASCVALAAEIWHSTHSRYWRARRQLETIAGGILAAVVTIQFPYWSTAALAAVIFTIAVDQTVKLRAQRVRPNGAGPRPHIRHRPAAYDAHAP